MVIYKFGNNTYPRRIRRRSNLGHIFREKKSVLWAGKYGTFTWNQLSSTSVLILCFNGIITSQRAIFTTSVSFWSLTLMTQLSIPAFVTQACVVRLACSMLTGFCACTPCRYMSSDLTMISLKAGRTTTLIYATTASTIQTRNNTLGYKTSKKD